MVYGIVCFIIGFLCGVVVASLMAIAKDADERQSRPADWWGHGL